VPEVDRAIHPRSSGWIRAFTSADPGAGGANWRTPGSGAEIEQEFVRRCDFLVK
jgi:hypothetical protein